LKLSCAQLNVTNTGSWKYGIRLDSLNKQSIKTWLSNVVAEI